MPHIMLDLETFGTKPGSVIRSIGACVFDPFSDYIGAQFYHNIEHFSCVFAGLTVDPGTEAWWKKQSQEAQDSLLVEPIALAEAAQRFREWWFQNKGVEVWAQGSNFDPPLWEAASAAVDVKTPWQFWNTRDTRTAYQIGLISDKSVPREGTYHNALDDALHQAKVVQMAIKCIREGK